MTIAVSESTTRTAVQRPSRVPRAEEAVSSAAVPGDASSAAETAISAPFAASVKECIKSAMRTRRGRVIRTVTEKAKYSTADRSNRGWHVSVVARITGNVAANDNRDVSDHSGPKRL